MSQHSMLQFMVSKEAAETTRAQRIRRAEVLDNSRPERDSIEAIRRQAQDALMQAAQSGRLESALQAAGLRRREVNSVNVTTIMQEARRRGRQLAVAGTEGNFGVCTICLEWIMMQDDFCTLHCLHFFHSCCIEHWLHSRHTCPNCRLSTDDRNDVWP
eukprot:TRINITY_DN4990_c0_g1_i1.p1 TRINITY_DN4990_c0_g1~~TRINITY_DN4990_c0_g1_i1.p1  ORF type:complete len:167 (-),score=31.31 TRINITY_DN4990_c0_g1_i1:25-498(-)